MIAPISIIHPSGESLFPFAKLNPRSALEVENSYVTRGRHALQRQGAFQFHSNYTYCTVVRFRFAASE